MPRFTPTPAVVYPTSKAGSPSYIRPTRAALTAEQAQAVVAPGWTAQRVTQVRLEPWQLVQLPQGYQVHQPV
jgi:hypothetical protein